MSANSLFAQVFGSLMTGNVNAYCTDNVIGRIKMYHDLMKSYGLNETMESFLRLLVEAKGDMHVKNEIRDEFHIAIDIRQ